MKAVACSQTRQTPPGKAGFEGWFVVELREPSDGSGTTQALNGLYSAPVPPVYPRMLRRNAPSRSKIEAQRPAGANPTAPGGHANGDNCAALHWATSRKPAHPGRARGALVKRASAAKAGQEWTEELPIPCPIAGGRDQRVRVLGPNRAGNL